MGNNKVNALLFVNNVQCIWSSQSQPTHYGCTLAEMHSVSGCLGVSYFEALMCRKDNFVVILCYGTQIMFQFYFIFRLVQNVDLNSHKTDLLHLIVLSQYILLLESIKQLNRYNIIITMSVRLENVHTKAIIGEQTNPCHCVIVILVVIQMCILWTDDIIHFTKPLSSHVRQMLNSFESIGYAFQYFKSKTEKHIFLKHVHDYYNYQLKKRLLTCAIIQKNHE